MTPKLTFDSVNDFVHHPSTEFEDLVSLSLALAEQSDRLVEALNDIQTHINVAQPGLHRIGTIYGFTEKALDKINEVNG